MKCPICEKEFDEHTGRRPKKFCSEVCKVKFFNQKKKSDRLAKEIEKESQNRNNTLVNAARGRDSNGVNNDEVKLPDGNEAILQQIAAIKAEKIPPLRDTILGRKSWKLEQEKRINELKQQLQ